MSDQRPERRRFQFGLRKLLLWTAAIAFLFGMAATLRGWVWTAAACWAIVVGGVRVATNPAVAATASVVAGLVLGAWIGAEKNPAAANYTLIECCVLGCAFGFVLFYVAEVFCCAVDTADNPDAKHDR